MRELDLDVDGQEAIPGYYQKAALQLPVRTLGFLATSPKLSTQDFVPNVAFTNTMRSSLVRVADAEVKAAQSRGIRGRRFRVGGRLIMSSEAVLDVDRDGVPEVAASFSAPLVGSREPHDPHVTLFLVVRLPWSGRSTVLLSWLHLPRFPGWEGSAVLETAIGVTGDGVAEIFTIHHMYEGGARTVFQMKSGRFVPVLHGPYRGC